MDRLIPIMISMVVLGATASHAASPLAMYWRAVLPNTPIPTVLQPGLSLTADVNAGEETGYWEEDPDAITGDEVATPLVGVGKEVADPQNYDTEHGAATPHGYITAAAEDEQVEKPRVYTAAHVDEATEGHRRSYDGTVREAMSYAVDADEGYNAEAATQVLNPIPFSTSMFPDILAEFSIHPDTVEAELIWSTLRFCEALPEAGETKHCATSLDSMTEFVVSDLGTSKVGWVETRMEKGMVTQQFKMTSAMKVGSNFVLCRVMPFAYRLYLCRTPPPLVEALTVLFESENGMKVDAIMICQNTNLQDDADCHFRPQGDIIWVPRNPKDRRMSGSKT